MLAIGSMPNRIRTAWAASRKDRLVFWTCSMALLALLAGSYGSTLGKNDNLKIDIVVMNLATGEPIHRGETLTSVTPFQITVTTNDVDCAGQFVVTALGAPGAPPSVLVEIRSFIIGPDRGTNTFSGQVLDSAIRNDWKVSASCNGAQPKEVAFDSFEFFVEVPEALASAHT